MARSMAVTVTASMEKFAKQLKELTYVLGGTRPKTLRQTWEEKMPVDVFEARMDRRRATRRGRRKNVALLKMIGGLLQVLFWLFVIVGTLAVIGLLFFSPFIALIVVACIAAGIVNALYRRGRES